ncbi:hypothetical protein PHYPSEUDO_012527 [Phytophthora pseudosyringae]|uniref:Uncharacterized protein n=1 Tax=Phytophthora pseudosyringae TaxID=221518 RepID=A0A8T1W5C6_9STRA|nr:hypothetical protein PHYPSEUDO_012527 [Phytophthora pseudosyringae]
MSVTPICRNYARLAPARNALRWQSHIARRNGLLGGPMGDAGRRPTRSQAPHAAWLPVGADSPPAHDTGTRSPQAPGASNGSAAALGSVAAAGDLALAHCKVTALVLAGKPSRAGYHSRRGAVAVEGGVAECLQVGVTHAQQDTYQRRQDNSSRVNSTTCSGLRAIRRQDGRVETFWRA